MGLVTHSDLVHRELIGTTSFIVVDVETTGLDAKNDLMLELALACIDKDGQILATFDSLIDHNIETDELVAMMAPVAEEMHVKSGLINDWAMMHKVNMTNDPSGGHSDGHSTMVEIEIVDFLSSCGFESNVFEMAGSSVQFDREMLREHMPSLWSFFHYRNADVSSLKQFCRKLNPKVFMAYEKFVADRPQNGGADLVHHRALDDVKASIQEYIFYKDNFLFVE